jgi:nicotinate-nucleotide adenylyltransferase
MRLGVFGGSFDPPHKGHLQLAAAALDQAQLDRVLLVPAARQPLKPEGPRASDSDRVEMLQLAIAEVPDPSQWEVSTLEIDRGGVSYTVETLAELQRCHPGAALFFLMGADSLAELPHWYEPRRILELATPLVVERPGHPAPDVGVLDSLVSASRRAEIGRCRVRMPAVDISSSQIRARIAEGGEWQSLVPRQVAHYIEAHGLYCT